NLKQNEFIELDLDELGYIKLYQKIIYYQKIQQESNVLRKVVTVKQIANPVNRSISPKALPLLDIKKEIYSKQASQNTDSSQILYFNNQSLQLNKSNSQTNLKNTEQQQQKLQNASNIKVVKVIKRDSVKSDFTKSNRSHSPKQESNQAPNKLIQQNSNVQMNKVNSQRSIKIQNGGSPLYRNKGINKDNNLFSLDYSQILNQSQQQLLEEGENIIQDNSKLIRSPSNKILNTSDYLRNKNFLKLNVSGGAQFRLRSTSPLQRQLQDKKFCSNTLQQQHENSFSALAKDGITLVKGTFVRHGQDQKNKETLLTNSLNTLGALQYFVQTILPPSHRIGTFYSMHCLHLYLDTHSFSIATMKKSDEEIENNLRFKDIRNQLRKEEATFDDEYEFFKNSMIQKDLEMKIKKKIINMKKYNQVMVEQIPKEILAPFSTQLMNNILNLINIHEANQYIIKYFAKLTEDLFAEVTINYYHSLQKAILDYLLLSDEIAIKLNYKRLFRKFDKIHIREAEEIIFMQDDEDILQQHYEKRFLKINLRFDEERDELQFDTPLPKIREEILNFLNSILKCVQHIERPEYTIFKSLDIFNEYSQFFEKQKQYVNIIDQDSEIFKDVYSYIERIIDSNFVEVAKILKIQKMYCQIFSHKKKIIKKIEIDNVKLEKKEITREYIRKRIKKIQVYSEQIQEDFSPFIRMNMIEVQCYQMRQILLNECFNLQMVILKDAKEYFLQKVNKVQQKVLDVIEEIKKPIEPSNYQHLINLEKKIHEIKIFEYNEIVLQQIELKKWIFYLLDYPYSQLSQNEFNKFYHLTKLIFSIITIAEKEEVRVKNERILVEKELQKEVRMLEGQTAKIKQQISELILKGDNSQSIQVIQEITEVKKQIFKANDWKQQIQKNQLLVGFDVTPMEQIDTFIQQIIAFERLWNLQALWEKNQVLWIKDTPMFKLDIKDIQNKIKYMKEEIDYLNNFPFEKLFQQVLQDPSIQKLLLTKQNQNQNIQNKGIQQKLEGPVKILKNIEKDLSLFEFHFEQLSYITHPALKQEDQEEIQNIVQVNLYKDRDHIALKRVIDTNVRKYLPEIDRILSKKLELFNIESTLERIIKDWSSTKIQFVFDENGLEYIEQQQLLQIVQKAQEHQVELFLVESYEKKEFEDKIHQLQEKMKSAEILGTLLMKVQDQWKRYFMFFDQNPDNSKKMPLEANYYSGIDKMWKIMNKFMKKVPSIYQFVAEVQFIEQLKKFDFIFNNIEFGVQRYINSVRSQCGKLFYVSDEQIFELVQEPKNIEKITEIVCNIYDNFDQLIILDGMSFLNYKRQIQAEKLIQKKNQFDNQKKKQKGILKNAQKRISKQDSNIQVTDQSSKNIQSQSIIDGDDADQENIDKDQMMDQDSKKVTMESQLNVLLDEDDIEREELIKTIREQEIEEIRKQKIEEEKREEEFYSQQKEQRYLIGVVGINNNSILFNLHLDINLLYGNSYEILNFISTQSQIKMQSEIHQVIQFRLSQDTHEVTDSFLKLLFNDFIFSATQVAEDYYFQNKISFLAINQLKNGENTTQSIRDILKYYIGYQKAICNYDRNNSKIRVMKEVKILQLIYYIEWLQREIKNQDFSESLESFDSIKRFKYNLNDRTGNLTFQIMNNVFQYGYNYFSPTKRIFRNIQSDKVFIFLCQNLLDFKFSVITHNRYKKDGKRSIIQEAAIMFGNLVFELHVQRIFSLNYFQNILQEKCVSVIQNIMQNKGVLLSGIKVNYKNLVIQIVMIYFEVYAYPAYLKNEDYQNIFINAQPKYLMFGFNDPQRVQSQPGTFFRIVQEILKKSKKQYNEDTFVKDLKRKIQKRTSIEVKQIIKQQAKYQQEQYARGEKLIDLDDYDEQQSSDSESNMTQSYQVYKAKHKEYKSSSSEENESDSESDKNSKNLFEIRNKKRLLQKQQQQLSESNKSENDNQSSSNSSQKSEEEEEEEEDISSFSQTSSESSESDQSNQSKTDSENENLENSNYDSIISSQQIEENLEASVNSKSSYISRQMNVQKQQIIKCNQIYSEKDYSQKRQKKLIKRIVLIDAQLDQQLCTTFKTPEKIVQESKQQVNLIKNNIFLIISCENLSKIDVDMINNYGLVSVDQSWDACFQYEHSYFKSSQIPQFFENYDVELIDFLFNQIFQPLVKWINSYGGESFQENQTKQTAQKFKSKFDDFKSSKKSIFLTSETQFQNNKKNSITSPTLQARLRVNSDFNFNESQIYNINLNSKKIIDTVSESSIRYSKIDESVQSALNQSKQNEEQAPLLQNRGILIFQISDKEIYFCLTRVFSLFLKPLQDEQIYNHKIFQNNMKNRSILIIQMFVFSLVSSVGQLVQIEYRKLFDQYLKDILLKDIVQFNKLVNNISLPQGATLFDFYLDTFLYKLVKEKNKQNDTSKFQFIFNSQQPKKDDNQINVFPLYEWKSYSESASQDILDKSNTIKLQSKGVNIDIQKLFFGNTLIVPTPQLVKTISMLNLLITNKIDVLVACSQNSFGRTTYLQQFVLSKKLNFNNSMRKHKEETMLKYTQLSANRRSILDQADTLSYYPTMKGEQENLFDRITGEESQLKQQAVFYRINTVTNYSVFMKFLTGNLKLTENSTYVPPQLCDQIIIVIDDINFAPLQSDNNPPSPNAPILETIRQIKYKKQFYTTPNDINYNVQFVNQVKNINFLLSFNPNHPYQIQRSFTKSFHIYGIDQLNEENLETIYLKTIKDKLLDCYQQYLIQIEQQQKSLHGITDRTIQGVNSLINSYSLKIVRTTLQYHKKCCELFPKFYNQQQLCHIFQNIMGLLQQSYIIDKKCLAQITIYLNWIEYTQFLQKQSEFPEKINTLFNQISQIAGSSFSYNLKDFFNDIQQVQSQTNAQKQNAIINQVKNTGSSQQINQQIANLSIEQDNIQSEKQNQLSSDRFFEGFIFKTSIQSLDSDEQNFELFIQQSGKQGENQINEFEKQIIWTTDIVQNQQSIFPYYFRKQTFLQTIKDQIENYNQSSTLKIQKIITSQFIYSLIRINHILINSKQNILIYSQPFSNRKKILSLICFINKIQFKYIKTDHLSDLIQISNKLKKYLRQTAISDEKYLIHIDDTHYTSKQIYDAISQIISCHSFENFFSSEEIRSISQQMKKANEKLKKFSDFEMQELMYYKMVQNIQYSISFQHTDLKLKQENENIYPFFKDQFQQLFLTQMNVNQLLEYAQQYIESLDNLIVSQSSQLYPLLNSIFVSMIQISGMKEIISNYKIFQSYLQILNSIFIQRSIYLQKKLDKMSEICQKIKVIIKSQKIIQRRLQDMIPSIEKEQASIDLISNKIDESQILIDSIKLEYDQKKKILEEKIQVSNQIQEEINIRIQHNKQNLESIEKQVINTDKNELYVLKQMKLPSNTMKLILQGLCFLIYPNPLEKRKNQQNGQIEIDWWAASVKILNNPKFLEDLVHLDKQTVGIDQINKVEALFEENQKFINSKVIENQQKGLKVIFQWMTSFMDYRKIEIEVEPLKQEYDNALNEQDILNQECQEILSKLEIEQGSFSILKNTQNDLIIRKKEIQQKFDILSQKDAILNTFINEAQQFFKILDIEKCELEQMQKNLLRDSCYSAIILNYFGRFNNSDRKDFKLHLRSSVNEFSQLEDEDLYNLLKFQFEDKQTEIDNLFLQNFNFDTFFIENYFILTNSVCLWTFSYDPLNILDQLKQNLKIDIECQHQDQKTLQEHLQVYSSQKVKILVKNVDTNFEKKYYNLIKKAYVTENDEFDSVNFDKKQLKINKQFELLFQTKNEDFFLQNKYNNYFFNLIDFSQRLDLENDTYKQIIQKKIDKQYQIDQIKKNIYTYIENSSVESETRLFADDFLKLVVDYFEKYKEIKQLNK
ncbi:hypothetical protein ABPG74_009248, partial [Tetrahymena malaccensis]